MLEFKLQTLTLALLHFVAAFYQTVLNTLGAAFQAFELGQLRAKFLLGIHGITLGRVGFKQRHLIVQYGNFHVGKGRTSYQKRSQENQLSQLTHDAPLKKLLSVSKVRLLESLAEGELENLSIGVIRFLDRHRQAEA